MSRPYLSSESGHHSQESLNAPSYALSQLQDDYTCQKTLYEFLQEFAEEEKAQDVGEQARSTEFDEMMAGFTEVFETDQQRQERLFLEADARQEETFQKREPLREAVFFEGQISRAAAFEVEQTSRAKRSEWHSAAREMLLVQGRQGRKDACTAVDAALVQQFDKLLKVQEDSFSSAESRRDGIVQKLLDDSKDPNSDSSANISFPVGIPPIPVGSPRILVRPLSRSSRSWSPPGSGRTSRSPRSPESPLPIVIRPISTPLGSTEETSLPTVLDSLEAQSILQRYMENRFQGAEAARDQAEAERTNVFEQKEQDRSRKSRAMLDSHTEHFRSREAARTEGHIRREGLFNAAQGRRSQTFDMSLSQIETQVEAENSLEDNLTKHMKNMTESLNKRQIAQLEAEREDQLTRFHEAQQRRSTVLEALSPPTTGLQRWSQRLSPSPSSQHYPPYVSTTPPPSVIYPSTPTLVHRPSWRGRSRSRTPVTLIRSPSPRLIDHRPPVIIQGPPPQTAFARVSSAQVPPARIRQPRAHRPPSPPVGFAATALFRGANVHLLPVPGSDYASTIDLRQQIFEMSEINLEAIFKKDAQRRHHIFNVNETRRQSEFQKKQRARKTVFTETEDGHNDQHKEDQRRREISFQVAEQKREVDFHQNESARDLAFKLAQDQRAEKFHATQEALQKKCFESEQRRLADLDSWGDQLLRGRKREQIEIYKSEEEAREDAFQRLFTTETQKGKDRATGDDQSSTVSISSSIPGSLRRGRSFFSKKKGL